MERNPSRPFVVISDSPFVYQSLECFFPKEKNQIIPNIKKIIFVDSDSDDADFALKSELVRIRFPYCEIIHASCFRDSMALISKDDFCLLSVGLAKYLDFQLPNIRFIFPPTDKNLIQKSCLTKEELLLLAENKKYFCSKIKSYLKQSRYDHSVSVAKTAYDICVENSFEDLAMDAFLAGLFHDISKDLEPSLQFEIGLKYFPNIASVEEFAYHQFASCYLAKTYFGLEKDNILQAISKHCTGCKHMGILDMILYTADKVEPTRRFPTEKLREEAFKSYSDGFVAVLQDQMNYFKKNNISFTGNPFSKEMYETYLFDK